MPHSSHRKVCYTAEADWLGYVLSWVMLKMVWKCLLNY